MIMHENWYCEKIVYGTNHPYTILIKTFLVLNLYFMCSIIKKVRDDPTCPNKLSHLLFRSNSNPKF